MRNTFGKVSVHAIIKVHAKEGVNWLFVVRSENLLLMFTGGVLPHACINPPKKIGTYVISQSLKTVAF